VGIFKNVGRTVGVVGGPVTMKTFELVVEHEKEGDERIGEYHSSEEDQGFLANTRPW